MYHSILPACEFSLNLESSSFSQLYAVSQNPDDNLLYVANGPHSRTLH